LKISPISLTIAASNKGLRLIFDLDPALNMPVRGDPMRLAQVLLNYTSNAIKFTLKGDITIRARVLEQRADDFLIRFEVEDTGIGISAAEIDNLFQAFHQADASTTRKYAVQVWGWPSASSWWNWMGAQSA